MEDIEQTKINREKLKKNPREKLFCISHLFFWWSLVLILKGWKTALTEDSLYEPLKDYQSKRLGDALEKLWKEEEKKKKPSLSRALLKLIGFKFMFFGVAGTLSYSSLLILQPTFLKIILDYFTPNQTDVTLDKAYFGAAMLVLTSLQRALFIHFCTNGLNNLGLKLKIACSSLIYRKALKIKQNGSDNVSVGYMVNLLSNDVNRFPSCLAFFYFLWVGPLNLVTVIVYLRYTLGYPALSGVSVIIFFFILQLFLSKKLSAERKNLAEKTDYRVRLINDVVCGMQAIKLYSWEDPYIRLIEEARQNEMKKINTCRKINLINFILKTYISKMCVFISVSVGVILGLPITSQYVFVMFNIYDSLKMSTTSLFQYALMMFIETRISVQRIQEYLLQDKDSPMVRTVESLSLDLGSNSAVAKSLFKKPEIRLRDVTAKWNLESPLQALIGVDFSASCGDLVGVVGRAGSGKSTLLNAILQEVNIVGGHVHVEGTLSFACQEPWIFSASVKQNILFGEEFDQEKYLTVLRVCALEHDLTLLPHGDQTRVGERGVMLSGGQKARINLARAVYRDADIYLLDDPLSAVDAHVAKKIFTECICGYLKTKCVVLVTHQVHFLQNVDKLYIVETGRVRIDDTEGTNLEHFSVKEFKSMKLSLKHELQSEVKEHRSSDGTPNPTYKAYFRAGGNWCFIALIFFLFFISQMLNNLVDYFVTFWANLENGAFTPKFSFTINNLLYIYLGNLVVLIVTSNSATLFFVISCNNASKNLHYRMLKRIVHATTAFFNQHSSGRILNRFTTDIGTVDDLVPSSLINVIFNAFSVFGVMCIIVYSNYWIVFPVIFLLTGIIFFNKIFQRTNQNLKRTEGTTRSAVFSHLSASVQGLTTIRAFGIQNKVAEEFDRHQDFHSTSAYLYFATFTAFGFWTDMMCVVFNYCVVFSFFFLNELPAVGNVGLAITQSATLLGSVQFAMRCWGQLESQMVSVERIEEYTKVDTEIDDEIEAPPEEWPKTGHVLFNDVSLKYSPNNPLVLKNISFEVKGGEKIGIIGRTGAGKTSLISVLFRLFDFTGNVSIDGVDTKTIFLNTLRSRISIIPQEPVLFLGTLRKNIDPFNNYSDEQIWKCLEETQLKDTISSLPSGLETTVSERGSNFSVGQRQLLCLVRAMLRNNKIIVLDEATANVDLKTDELIQSTIRKKFKDCTVLTIAHRLNTVLDSNKVLVMDEGRMVEFDDPFVLLQNPQSLFYGYVIENGSDLMEKFLEVAKSRKNEKRKYMSKHEEEA